MEARHKGSLGGDPSGVWWSSGASSLPSDDNEQWQCGIWVSGAVLGGGGRFGRKVLLRCSYGCVDLWSWQVRGRRWICSVEERG